MIKYTTVRESRGFLTLFSVAACQQKMVRGGNKLPAVHQKKFILGDFKKTELLNSWIDILQGIIERL
jgi:hypothetical protein